MVTCTHHECVYGPPSLSFGEIFVRLALRLLLWNRLLGTWFSSLIEVLVLYGDGTWIFFLWFGFDELFSVSLGTHDLVCLPVEGRQEVVPDNRQKVIMRQQRQHCHLSEWCFSSSECAPLSPRYHLVGRPPALWERLPLSLSCKNRASFR